MKKLRYNQSNVIKAKPPVKAALQTLMTLGVGTTQLNFIILNSYSLPHLTVSCKFYLPIFRLDSANLVNTAAIVGVPERVERNML